MQMFYLCLVYIKLILCPQRVRSYRSRNAGKKSRKKVSWVTRTCVNEERGLRQGTLCTPVARAGSHEIRPRTTQERQTVPIRVREFAAAYGSESKIDNCSKEQRLTSKRIAWKDEFMPGVLVADKLAPGCR
ncbi:hypothetical protein QE152_g10046 [Popillia japonica]|uniref:Secreted protein n=1 Tax=Popillia japonica TaxID=7064 RepID=A0AAW1LWA8_POPJA